MKKVQTKLIFLIHAIVWGIIFFFPFFFVSKDGNSFNWIRYMGYFFVPVAFMIIFYANYCWLIDRLLFRRKLVVFILSDIVLISVVWLLLNTWQDYHFLHYIKPYEPQRMSPSPPRLMFILRDYTVMALTAGLSVAIKMTQSWFRMETERKETERRQVEAELKSLKNQLNPHFLFNTLNNIYSLISFSPEKAQHAVHDLSRLLRYVLYENNQNFVPLMKEMEFINNYIALMKIRLPEQVKVVTDICAESDIPVAPLLFITLIENAFKHGVSATRPSFVSVELKTAGDREIVCRIINSYFPKDEKDGSGSGIGLDNLQKRLALLYPGRHMLDMGKRGEEYVAELRIRCNGDEQQKRLG